MLPARSGLCGPVTETLTHAHTLPVTAAQIHADKGHKKAQINVFVHTQRTQGVALFVKLLKS